MNGSSSATARSSVRSGCGELVRLPEDELARVQDEWLVVRNRQELGQVRLRRADVDLGISSVVAEDPKAPVEMEIDRRRLEIDRVVGRDFHGPGVERGANVPVGQDAHLATLPLPRSA